jgi:sucrose phosphorylase
VLPLLTLHTLTSGSGAAMKHWFSICPRKQFTVLDTHDGIGVFDAAGIVNDDQAQAVIAKIEDNLSYAFKPLDPDRKKYYRSYQLYGTYYSILKKNDKAYLLARALQFFAPGIPQVYYVGMLAGENQIDFPIDSPRDINRKNYTMQELEAEFDRPVVRQLLALMRLRNNHPAFDGELEVDESPDHILSLRRINGSVQAVLTADLRTHDFQIMLYENGEQKHFQFV